MRYFIGIFLISILLNVAVQAQSIKISLLNSKEVNSFTVTVKQGRYLLKGGNEIMGEYKKGSIFHISRFGNTIQVRDKRNFIGDFNSVELNCTANDGVLNIKSVNPIMKGQEYDDNLAVNIQDNRMRLINKLDMEKYIAAVIEAEGGNGAKLQYYMAQAVLIRTFTIKNMFKHAEEGFDLCDEVHCQAYKHRCTQNPEILKATRATAGQVLVDSDDVLIMSPFHSNCGGKSSPSGMVWQRDLPYLQSVDDPFCINQSNALWTATIAKSDWLSFLSNYTGNKTDYSRYNFSFQLPPRTKFISIHGIELNLRTIREHFGLRSAYYAVEDNGSELIFKGKGYGHGVGMCQQGAMEMARVNYTWKDIIHFYFQDIQVRDYREMELHRFKPE